MGTTPRSSTSETRARFDMGDDLRAGARSQAELGGQHTVECRPSIRRGPRRGRRRRGLPPACPSRRRHEPRPPRPPVRRPPNACEPSRPFRGRARFTTTSSHLRMFDASGTQRMFDAPGTQLAAEIPG